MCHFEVKVQVANSIDFIFVGDNHSIHSIKVIHFSDIRDDVLDLDDLLFPLNRFLLTFFLQIIVLLFRVIKSILKFSSFYQLKM